ncbi:MAG TPA: selenide, water dikinase SelD, partial [Actinomycetota bacterium]|nr:selenide, water dikinase SelD [Actinomycetota bacterium]
MTTTHTDPAVLVGLDAPDDAAVYRLTDEVALVQTVDFFTPIVDDARTWGRIAAANALSDVYAMGGRPISALNLVGWPRALDFEILGAVLEGGEEVCRAAGVAIVGGHSVDDPEPKYGLSVTGTVHPDRIVRKTGARAGDALVLTKALGTGLVSSGIKEGRAREDAVAAAVTSMTTLNADAAEAMVTAGAHAATDVTGFGLIGHLLGLLGEGLDAVLDAGAIPVLPQAEELARAGVVPGGT